LTLAVPDFADTIVASGAGALPGSAEDLTGDSSLSEIDGALVSTGGVDMFKIDILNPVDFFALTVSGLPYGIPDPALYLFNSSGRGVYANDDMSGGDTQACLPSAGAYDPCPSSRGGSGPLAAGIYYLAITRSGNSPLSADGHIFSPLFPTDVVGPDLAKGGGDPINGWDYDAFTGPDYDLIHYDIQINDTPEPATWPLLTAAAAACILYRRKSRVR
jgi:hypothetical protein